MVKLLGQLELDRCPYCNVDQPSLHQVAGTFDTSDNASNHQRFWKPYRCLRCGGVVLASSLQDGGDVVEIYPTSKAVSDEIPEPAKSYLRQAVDSIHAPAGSVMLAASSIDAMLKSKSYREGSLYSRIDLAAKNHLITQEMALWAHNVRLDANEQRHADPESPLPSPDDARRSIDFAVAFAEFLFVLPSKVSKGLKESQAQPQSGAS